MTTAQSRRTSVNQSLHEHLEVRCLMTLNMSDPATAAGEAGGGGVEAEPPGQTRAAGHTLAGGTQQQDSET